MALCLSLACFSVLVSIAPLRAELPLPNVVVIFIDDMGYADIGSFGATAYPTPHLDRMASEGIVLRDFHAATAVCSASRAALLTGCYPERVGILGALSPRSRIGLNPNELTIAELCKSRGYTTAVFGKWHLGHHRPFLPAYHGFDEWFGLPYSNDMWPQHPDFADLPKHLADRKRGLPPLQLYEGMRVVDSEVSGQDQAQLTTLYTERAVDFIASNRSQPFFLYLSHSMVHVPLFVSDKFAGKSGAGLFGDVVMEIDWSVGQILEGLKANDVDDNTLVIFTSDNGPWLRYGEHAGSAGKLREGKGTLFEGGTRVPCIARWPGRIPAGKTCDELSTAMDVLPTIAELINADLPANQKIDGKNIWPLLTARPGAESPHEAFFYYYQGELHAVRDRRYKLHFPHKYRTMNGRPGGKNGTPAGESQQCIGLELFDLKKDPSESTDISASHPDVVVRLTKLANVARSNLGDRLTKTQGTENRQPGRMP